MADLVVKITEDLTLNGMQQGGSTSLTRASIADIFKRVYQVATTEQPIYTTHDSETSGSQLDDDNIKYARITNNGTAYITLRIKNADNDEFVYKLNAGESFLLYQHEATMNAATASTIDIGTGWHDITSVKATSSSSTQAVEVLIAST